VKLNFNLLVIDDNATDLAGNALLELEEFLSEKGFSLRRNIPTDISSDAIEALAQAGGAEYDLVIIDYMLGANAPDGSVAAATFRRLMPYTDIIFYSSSPSGTLLQELAQQGVAGVFVANRTDNLGDALVGIAQTIIGKAVDLTHMRGIALAEVADMDVMLEDVLHRAFSAAHDAIPPTVTRTLSKLTEGGKSRLEKLEKHEADNEILLVVKSNLLFSLADKYRALSRVGTALGLGQQVQGLQFQNIIDKRNLLAHARESVGQNGSPTLRSIKDDQEIEIDDVWMTALRTELRDHRVALDKVCGQIDAAIA
jgi:CheY-like chemotaxis protein